MQKEEVEDQRGEEAAAAAATAVELPNSTTSTMETSGDGEGPDSGEPPPHSVPTQRSLECLMRDITLEAKDGDIIFPITAVGRPPPYDHELSAENHKRVEEAMKKIPSLHLQAIYNAGAVRQVDRILVELLMAQFTRVNQMMGADLNTSLQELFTVMETSGGAENSSGAHSEQPGPLQFPTSCGVPQLTPLHVFNQGVGFLGLCEVRRL